MSEIKLLNRIDNKYLTNISVLPELLYRLSCQYYIQEVGGKRVSAYNTVYYETNDNSFYIKHHNGCKPRAKVRERCYSSNSMKFFEIKSKDNHGVTNKKRVEISGSESEISHLKERLLTKKVSLNFNELIKKIENNFNRITLVNYGKNERVTIDFDIKFKNLENEICKSLNDIVIIEIKRETDYRSEILFHLNEMRIKPVSISKYCIGCAITDKNLKSNLFKSKLMYMNKITDYKYGFL